MKNFVGVLYSLGVVLAGAGAVAAQSAIETSEAVEQERAGVITVSEVVEHGVAQDSLPACAFAALVGCF